MNEKLTLKKKVVANLNEDQLGSVNGATTWPCSYVITSLVYSAVDNSVFTCANSQHTCFTFEGNCPSTPCGDSGPGYSSGCGNTGENGYA